MKPTEAAWRALCLYTLFGQGWLAQGVAFFSGDEPEAMGIPPDLVPQLRAEHEAESAERLKGLAESGILDRCSPLEREMLLKPPEQWSDRETINASWRAEALGAILWALGRRNSLGAYDQAADHDEIRDAMRGARTNAQDFVRGAKLRDPKIILRARDDAELWLWRARTTFFAQNNPSEILAGNLTYDEVIRLTAAHAAEKGMFTPINEDFPLFGKAYRDLTEDELATAGSIATERLTALNWLCRQQDDWDDITADT